MFTKREIITFSVSLFSIVYYCENIIYTRVLSKCEWPDVESNTGRANLRVMLLADAHLLGYRKSLWVDKLRREWEMYLNFQTAITLFEPELVFILGDVMDEGYMSEDVFFNDYLNKFNEVFAVPSTTQLYVTAGNHDVGFHYVFQRFPYLGRRFDETFNTSGVGLVSKKGVHFVTVNSVAMEGDHCDLCSRAEYSVKLMTARLKCANRTGPCKNGYEISGRYSRPILLQHYPMYRPDDSQCATPPSQIGPFKQRWDCLSKEATKFLTQNLWPRLVISGHTHQRCRTTVDGIEEYTIPSFNYRNNYDPSFILAVINSKEYAVNICYMPLEYEIFAIYVIYGLSALAYLVLHIKRTYFGRKLKY